MLRRSLMAKLLGLFLAVALVPVALLGYLSYRTATNALNTAEFQKLNALRDQVSVEVNHYVEGCFNAAMFLADYDRVNDSLASFPVTNSDADKSRAHDRSTPAEHSQADIRARLDRFMGKYLKFEHARLACEDVMVIRPDGYVIYTSEDRGEFGENVLTGTLRDTGLARVFTQVQTSQKASMADFDNYRPAKAPSAFVGVPVLSPQDKRQSGVLVLRIGLDGLNRLAKLTKSAAKTAKMYLLRSDGIMLTKPHLQQEAAPLSLRVENEAVADALKDRTGHRITTDYRGAQVFCSCSHLGLNENRQLGTGFDWALSVEVDASEAIEPVHALALRILVIALVVAVAVGMAGVLLARGISRPMKALGGAAARIGRGDLTVRLPDLKRHDEMGVLASSFRTMVDNLSHQIGRVTEGIHVLHAAASEISATVSQVASSTAQTSSAVTEASTTVAQVKQAARIASEKAKDVATVSREAVETLGMGRKATEDTIERMRLIQAQVESIGETVVRLSEHSRIIEEIIGTVQDLADQSNLLAVNASIEAARAGDQGKGFAVVAQEIKALADQSRDATEQIRSILGETRQWIAAVAMATEQGNKAVEAGVQQSEAAVESIAKLSGTLDASSHAATVIDVSSQQQLAGVEQVSQAMVKIDQAIRDTGSSAYELQAAAGRLAALGAELKILIGKYHV